MLVLSRKRNEKIVLQVPASEGRDAFEVTICMVELISRRCGGVVRIGIEAPEDVKVWRKELHDGFAT